MMSEESKRIHELMTEPHAIKTFECIRKQMGEQGLEMIQSMLRYFYIEGQYRGVKECVEGNKNG
jgi:hypothetical protein